MRYAVISNEIVENIIEAEEALLETILAFDWTRIGDVLKDGKLPSAPVPPPLTPEELMAQITVAIQTRLDTFAQTRFYDSIMSAATYATSGNTMFAAEGQYAVDVRDNTWAKAYEVLNDVQAGKRPMPSWEDIEKELPVLAWPEGSLARF